MIDRDKTISHLRIIRTWAAVNPRYGMGIDMSDCEKVVEWIDDALGLLKMQEPKTIVNKWHKNPLGDYSRLHCPWCDRELDRRSAKEYVACPYCGRAVKYK